ncbi:MULTISPECIES: hypothetical protein [Pseudomonas chlororaphis group]|uniref:hypothetical protein n=1 Tax=Pseudomonas chlororaphis group TaxID=136842 RepID=UPI00209745AF|nr:MULTISPECIES: hypothetical protein [Pseudomonas chlororaphis group]MCO7575322.1 hypothetical protein [Pseudomonas protegens]MCO7582575.1 hypothetical protein [Pseudomonas chlororaphis]MCO7599246.1 hypothetical protein [Pseudomonas chlororaphis]
MTTQPQTVDHEFCIFGQHAVLQANGGIPLHESLDAATDYLEAAVAGLRELIQEPSVSNRATLVLFAADTALALVYAAHAGVEPAVEARHD